MSVDLAELDLDRFVGVPEASARLNLHPDTAYKWIKSGRWQREFPDVPVQVVAGKQQISLRLLVGFINRRTAA